MKKKIGPETIARINLHDPLAFEFVYDRTYRPLLHFVYNIIRNWTESEDIVSESFRKLLTRREHLNSLQDIKAFLYITARNSAIDYIRFRIKQLENRVELENVEVPTEENILVQWVKAEMAEELRIAMSQLPKDGRNILMLHYYEGLSLTEIAARMNNTKTNIRQKKFNSLKKLFKIMKAKCLLPVLLAIYPTFF